MGGFSVVTAGDGAATGKSPRRPALYISLKQNFTRHSVTVANLLNRLRSASPAIFQAYFRYHATAGKGIVIGVSPRKIFLSRCPARSASDEETDRAYSLLPALSPAIYRPAPPQYRA
ncbi:unnamed protein product, partial [Nesidiocoris tenuis]